MELEDFIDFLRQTSEDRQLRQAAARLSEGAFAKEWDNEEDAEYARLKFWGYSLETAIDLAPMANIHDNNYFSSGIKFVDNAVVTNPVTPWSFRRCFISVREY
jgi:hypothetical protein